LILSIILWYDELFGIDIRLNNFGEIDIGAEQAADLEAESDDNLLLLKKL